MKATTATTTRRNLLATIAAMAAGWVTGGVRAQGSAGNALESVVFENEKVRVYRVTTKAGPGVFGSEGGTHPPRLAVFMTDGKVKAAAKTTDYKQGDMLWDPGDSRAAENVGKREIVVYLVEPKRAAPAAKDNAWKASPVVAGGRILLENDVVRVIEHSARPRMGVCGEGMHTHPEHLTIDLTGGKIKIMKPEAEPVIREARPGAVFWDKSGPHAIQNLGSRTSRTFLIEIKTA
jgi:hypothetical protein